MNGVKRGIIVFLAIMFLLVSGLAPMGNRVYAATTKDFIETVAGAGTPGYSGDGGPALHAKLRQPTGVAIDRAGNLYLSDSANHVIRKVDLAGNISTVAGNGSRGYSGDGGLATSAQLNIPRGIAFDDHGNLYIADSENHRIRMVDLDGKISVAGTGTAGYSGDGGLATSASFNRPVAITFDRKGNLLITDRLNSCIRMIDPVTGIISTLAGRGIAGFSGDGGPAALAQLNYPVGIAVDNAGYLYIADTTNARIRKFDPVTGIISTLKANLNYPSEIAVDSAGNLYFQLLNNNHRIRKIEKATGNLITVAGMDTNGYSGDGGLATSALLNSPSGLAIDSAGHLYFPDQMNHRIRKVTFAAAPSAPTNLTATAGIGKVTLSWDPVNGADEYKIYRSTTAGTSHSEIATVSGSVYSYEAAGLFNGTTYYFTVKASAPGGDSGDSIEASATTIAQVAAPSANPAGGSVAYGTTVTLNTSEPGASIYYTTDGSTPTDSSTLYSSPIVVTGDMTIKAFAVKSGLAGSEVMSEHYTILAPQLSPATGNFDKNTSTQTDVTTTIIWNGDTLENISLGGTELVEDTDYSVSGNVVTIKKSFLAGQTIGTKSLLFTFALGTSLTFAIDISDTTQVPGAPMLKPAVPGNAQASLEWSPVDGSTGYTIYQSDDPASVGSEAGSVSGSVYAYTATGLTNGMPYYFTVKGTNDKGDSPLSNIVSTTPFTVPGAPTIGAVTAGNGEALVHFTPPSDDGGRPITSYEVTTSPGGITGAGSTSPIKVTGLTNGTSYTFIVKAINLAGSGVASAESNSVTPSAPPIVTPSVPNEPEKPVIPVKPEKPDTGVAVFINSIEAKAETATVEKTNKDGQHTTTVALVPTKLEEQLAGVDRGAVIAVQVAPPSDVTTVELSGPILQYLAQQQAIVEVRTEDAIYRLPLQRLDAQSLIGSFGDSATLQELRVQLEIAKPTTGTVRLAENAAAQGEFALIVPPVNFTVRGIYGAAEKEVTKFDNYVERMIALPDGTDSSQATTAVVVEPDGTIRHVPTRMVTLHGKAYAKVYSLSNSTYAVIRHSVTFNDVTAQWAKDAVDDLGSRMVVSGDVNSLFRPDHDITRAEFAAILVRGLGLKAESGAESPFSDVKPDAWYNGAVPTAHTYHLINGFGDGTFRPADNMTREQAMAIIANAMNLTGLKDQLLSSQVEDELLKSFVDENNISVWARDGISAAIQAGIVSGRGGKELAPKAFITRAEAAVMVQKLLRESKLID
ncbi:S-layer homology domain-containing protein [Paenibacillus sp. SAF-054]|uniref:NHL domain-containing protein n=2 Tax=unclassified Paenibacillus TaxID=185978 RepID=UPI003F8125EC